MMKQNVGDTDWAAPLEVFKLHTLDRHRATCHAVLDTESPLCHQVAWMEGDDPKIALFTDRGLGIDAVVMSCWKEGIL